MGRYRFCGLLNVSENTRTTQILPTLFGNLVGCSHEFQKLPRHQFQLNLGIRKARSRSSAAVRQYNCPTEAGAGHGCCRTRPDCKQLLSSSQLTGPVCWVSERDTSPALRKEHTHPPIHARLTNGWFPFGSPFKLVNTIQKEGPSFTRDMLVSGFWLEVAGGASWSLPETMFNMAI